MIVKVHAAFSSRCMGFIRKKPEKPGPQLDADGETCSRLFGTAEFRVVVENRVDYTCGSAALNLES